MFKFIYLFAGQPPGTVIKCVTAQVIQTQQGPRIVLQGLQGADFTPQQLSAVQQQVKQQLLKGELVISVKLTRFGGEILPLLFSGNSNTLVKKSWEEKCIEIYQIG